MFFYLVAACSCAAEQPTAPQHSGVFLLSTLERLASERVAWREFKYCPICDYEMLTWRETQVTCSKKCQGEYERRQRNYPVEEWGKLYQAGATYRQIAEQYKVSYAVVRRNTQKAGFPPRTDHEHLARYRGQNSQYMYDWHK